MPCKYLTIGISVGRCLCCFPQAGKCLVIIQQLGSLLGGVYVFYSGTSLVHVAQASGRTKPRFLGCVESVLAMLGTKRPWELNCCSGAVFTHLGSSSCCPTCFPQPRSMYLVVHIFSFLA